MPATLPAAPFDADSLDPSALPPTGPSSSAEAPIDPSDDTPAPPSPEEEAAARRAARIEQIVQRLERHADFPALRESIRGIQKVARSDVAHLRALSDEVLTDTALTHKLLRLINTAYYSSVGGGQITTITRAIALMGFQAIGMMAASLVMFERLPKGADGARVREEFACNLLAALIANEFCPARKLQESAYIAAMFQNLGSMLAWLHLADEAREVDAQLQALDVDGQALPFAASSALRADPQTVERVSRDVLGVGYQDLGSEIAQLWGWPESLARALRPLPTPGEEEHIPAHEHLRGVATAANRLARDLFGCPPQEREARLQRFLADWGFGLGLGQEPEKLQGMVERSLAEWTELAPVMNLPRPELLSQTLGTPAKPASGGRTQASAKPVVQQPKPATGPQPAAALKATAAAPARPAAAPRAPKADDPKRLALLSSGIESLSLALLSDRSLADLTQDFMQVLAQALQLHRVVLCLKSPAPGGALVGRFGLDATSRRMASAFNVPLQPPSDLFGLLCLKGVDTLISDTHDPLIAQRLPGWFQQQVRSRSFLLLPMQRAGQVIGMVYADHPDAALALQVTERELGLVKGLRNQMLLALQLREGSARVPG